MRKNILIVAAPFGYGPASIALLIAEDLAKEASVTILSDRDAFSFVEKYGGEGVSCRKGVFRMAFSRREEVARFDRIICVSNELAVHCLIQMGFAERTVFVDCLLPWRSEKSPRPFAQKILAYLVQDYPEAGNYLRDCQAELVELTGPMVWATGDAGNSAGAHKSVVLQLGGVTSPLVGWEVVEKSIAALLSRVAAFTAQAGRDLTIIGSQHLGSLQLDLGNGVKVRGDVGPREAATLISSAELVLTTPGIGTVYEAMVCGTPALLLPPMNSTQLSQYRVFTEGGFTGVISPAEFAEISAQAAPISWDKQTLHVVAWLNRNRDRIAGETGAGLARLLAADSGEKLLADLRERQQQFRARLSGKGVLPILRKLALER